MPQIKSNNIYQTALRILARRELSRAQLRDRLSRYSPSPSEMEAVIARLVHERAIDDTRMALAHARRSAEVKFHGKSRAQREIEAAGIDQETAHRAVAEVFNEVGEESVLECALKKQLDGLIRGRAQFRRLHQALLRRGFPPDRIATMLMARAERGNAFVEE